MTKRLWMGLGMYLIKIDEDWLSYRSLWGGGMQIRRKDIETVTVDQGFGNARLIVLGRNVELGRVRMYRGRALKAQRFILDNL